MRRLAFVSLILPAAALAEPTKLGGPEIKETFTGSQIELDTPLGTTIPIRFTGDGLMTGRAGSLASVLGAAQDRGRWWVKGNRLCYKWFRWFEAQEQCLSIRVKDERVFWHQDDGKRGTATIVGRPTAVAEAPAVKIPVRRVSVEAVESPSREVAKTPVLKVAPRLAVRPKSAAEQLGVDQDGPADRSLFFVGLGLSRALNSQLEVASAEDVAPQQNRKSDAPVRVEAKAPPKVAARAAPKAPAVHEATKPGTGAPLAKTTGTVMMAESEVTSSSDLAPARPIGAPAPVSFSVYGVAADDVLNMRSGPSEEYAIVGRIPANGIGVRLVGGCIAFWCEIQFRTTRGWVNRYYLAQN